MARLREAKTMAVDDNPAPVNVHLKTAAKCGLVLAMVMLVPMTQTSEVRAQDFFTQGDYWLYDLAGGYPNTAVSGVVNLSYAGLTTMSVAGKTYDVYDLIYDSDFSWTGSITGTSTSIQHSYVDVISENTVAVTYNESDYLTIQSGGSFEAFNGWVYNMTSYDPPGGQGNWPSTLNTGDTWNITYTEVYEERTFNGSFLNSTSGSWTYVTTYYVRGSQTITVPAGTFNCLVIQESTPESTYTRWYSSQVGSDVKQNAVSSSGENLTWLLRSYSFAVTSTPNVSGVYLSIGAGVAITATVIVLLLFMRRRRPHQSMLAGQSNQITISR